MNKSEEIYGCFISLIEGGKYYDAHEVLESIWYPKRFEKDDETLLIKGFINASVAFALAKKGKMDQARRVWKIYMKYRPLLKRVKTDHISTYNQIDTLLKAIHAQILGA